MIVTFIVALFVFVKKEHNDQHRYTVVFEDQNIGNNERKWSCVECNYNYYVLETQFMTQYSYPTDAVFAGDSITYRCQWNEIFPDIDVKNRGIPSDSTEGLLARIDSIIKTQPKKVFIMIGINDLALGKKEDTIHENYRKILDELLEVPDIEIYVQSILPVSESLGISKNAIIKLNGFIEDICLEQGATYIDLYSDFSDIDGWLKGEYSLDGIHINAKGYECWKSNIERYID